MCIHNGYEHVQCTSCEIRSVNSEIFIMVFLTLLALVFAACVYKYTSPVEQDIHIYGIYDSKHDFMLMSGYSEESCTEKRLELFEHSIDYSSRPKDLLCIKIIKEK